jgi:hypothetical protein
MAALCVSCGGVGDEDASTRAPLDMSVPALRVSGADERVARIPSTPEPVGSLASALLGSWAVEFGYSTGDHHTVISGDGYVHFDEASCVQDMHIKTDVYGPGVVHSSGTLLRGDGSGLLWRGSDDDGRIVWEETPQRHLVWSPLTVSPGDIVAWPPAGVCGLVDASVSGGAWPVERLVSAASAARRSALADLAGVRSECVDRWEGLMDDESRVTYEVGLFAETTYEVSVDPERIRFVQDNAIGHRVFLELTRTSRREVAPVPTAETFERSLAASLPYGTCDDLFVRFLAV